MGNEQSSSSSASTVPSTSTFSFLAGRAASLKKSKGIIVVRDGANKQESIEEDEMYKRFQEIPRFLPILRHTIGRKDSATDSHHRMGNRPIYKMASRFQEHLHICAKIVSTDQSQLGSVVKSIDISTSSVTNHLVEKKKSYDKFLKDLQNVTKIHEEVVRIQLLLEKLVPIAETLNELLVPCERLPELNLSHVLERTPVTSSESSMQSTPRHVYRATRTSSQRPSPAHTQKSPNHIEAVDEVKVVDR